MPAPRPVVINSEDAPRDGWDDPIKGRVAWRTLFSGDITPTDALTAGVAELEPGGWLGIHEHTPAEIYYVLEGQGVVTLADDEHHVRHGSAVFIPGGLKHGIRNAGPATLRFVYVFPVAAFNEVEYRFGVD